MPFDDDVSDIWGFEGRDGTEYAIMGLHNSTAVISLADPASPELIARIPGTRSVWRDMKSHGDYVYVVADQGEDGLLIIDMASAPDTVTWDFWKPELDTLGVNGTINKCHNLYIDAGYVYLSGCNINGGGIVILDLNVDPENPRLAGLADPRYSHDNFTRGDTIWSGDINNGYFSVIDASDKANPVTLATQNTSRNFAHNTWLSDDGRYLFTTDERPDANVDAYDVSDLDNIRRLDVFRPKMNEQRGTIPHNAHYYRGYLVTSWYTDGVIITDVHKPDNMVQVGQYDTWEGPDGGFFGAWGAYPFLKSGLLLVSDINSGLYVLDVNYTRAAYLEGVVTDSETGEVVLNAELTIDLPEHVPVQTDLAGEYKTGLAAGGTVTVRVNHPEYYEATASVELVAGQVVIRDFALEPKPKYTLGGTVRELGGIALIPDAHVILSNENTEYEAVTDIDGAFAVEVLEGTYDVQVAAWGYRHLVIEDVVFKADDRRAFELEKGYQDDFFAELSWTVTGDASAGIWERAIPEGTLLGPFLANPNEDTEGDIGNKCYVTGNDGRNEVGRDDVDNGATVLSSPVMQLADYIAPVLEFDYWYMGGGGATAFNDTFRVFVTNKLGDSVELFKTQTIMPQWRRSEKYFLADHIILTDEVQVHFVAADDRREGHIVEAAVDAFVVYDANGTSQRDLRSIDFEVFPSPFESVLTIRTDMASAGGPLDWQLIELNGRLLKWGTLTNAETSLHVPELASGSYMLRLTSRHTGRTSVKTVIKQ